MGLALTAAVAAGRTNAPFVLAAIMVLSTLTRAPNQPLPPKRPLQLRAAKAKVRKVVKVKAAKVKAATGSSSDARCQLAVLPWLAPSPTRTNLLPSNPLSRFSRRPPLLLPSPLRFQLLRMV